MRRIPLILVAAVLCLATDEARGQLASIKPVSSTPLRLQSLGNRPAVKTGNFQSIQTMRDQPVHLARARQQDLESEIKALEKQEGVAPGARDTDIQSQSTDDLVFPGPIREARINILAPDKPTPEDRSAKWIAGFPESWDDYSTAELLVHWDAPQTCYRRLYFEDPLLERYGQSTCNLHLDSIRSEIHYAVSTVMWPLRATLDIPGKCETNYGYCRPGTPLPKMRQHLLAR